MMGTGCSEFRVNQKGNRDENLLDIGDRYLYLRVLIFYTPAVGY